MTDSLVRRYSEEQCHARGLSGQVMLGLTRTIRASQTTNCVHAWPILARTGNRRADGHRIPPLPSVKHAQTKGRKRKTEAGTVLVCWLRRRATNPGGSGPVFNATLSIKTIPCIPAVLNHVGVDESVERQNPNHHCLLPWLPPPQDNIYLKNTLLCIDFTVNKKVVFL